MIANARSLADAAIMMGVGFLVWEALRNSYTSSVSTLRS
jgi:hypothetical protein